MTNPFNKDGAETIAEDSNTKTEVNPDAEIEVNEDASLDSDNNDSTSSTDSNTDLAQKYDILNNQYIRLAADFDNYRKRQAQERESLLKYGAENILKKLLEVLDNFERGAKSNETVDDCETLKESFNLIHKQLMDVLSKSGLEVIEAEGQIFDPNFHEAVMQTPTDEYPEHTIIAELQKGYKLGDRVLRPTLVNVATAQ